MALLISAAVTNATDRPAVDYLVTVECGLYHLWHYGPSEITRKLVGGFRAGGGGVTVLRADTSSAERARA